MRVFVDLDTRAFITSPQNNQVVSRLAFTRRDNVPVDVIFTRSGEIVELESGAAGKLGIKTGYDATGFLAYDGAWTKSGTGTDTIYRFSLNLNTEEMDEAFDEDPDDLPAKVEIEWSESGTISSTLPTAAVIYNDLITGDEGAPVPVSENFTLTSPDTSVWTITIGNDGVLSATKA
jgi:hypothetical protein